MPHVFFFLCSKPFFIEILLLQNVYLSIKNQTVIGKTLLTNKYFEKNFLLVGTLLMKAISGMELKKGKESY